MISSEAFALPGSTGGVAIINFKIAVVGNLTAESLGLFFVEVLSPL